MLPPGYTLRDVEHGDFERIAELVNRIEQEPVHADELRNRWRNKNRIQWRRVVVFDGRIVGFAHSLAGLSVRDGIFLVRADVDESHQHQGIGRTLFELAEAFAWESNADIAVVKARDDMPRERRFCEAAGYRLFSNLRGVALDLTTFRRPAVPPGEEAILNWAQIGDTPENRRRLYDLNQRTDRDSPGADVWGSPSYENWLTAIIEARWFLPEGALIATLGGEWIGMAIVGPTEDGSWTTDYTGVLPEYRGKGVATRLKVAGIEVAIARGARELHTFNEELNGPMRAINAKLGFQAQTGFLYFRKDP
jgi:mycothiol synthase